MVVSRVVKVVLDGARTGNALEFEQSASLGNGLAGEDRQVRRVLVARGRRESRGWIREEGKEHGRCPGDEQEAVAVLQEAGTLLKRLTRGGTVEEEGVPSVGAVMVPRPRCRPLPVLSLC